MTPSSHYLACEGRELHYTEWGAGQPEVVVAWHGLARTGRDMDDIAAHLAPRFRVICPDTLGRGLSQWSPLPDQEYRLAFYAAQAASLLDQLGIQRLVLDDIGPELAAPAVARIRSYAGSPVAFATVSELEQYFRGIYKPYGALTDAQWRRLTETRVRRLPDGRVTPHYDPAMVRQLEAHPGDYDQWPAWDALRIPVLALRGEHSDLLLPEVAEAMRQRGPRAVVVTVPDCGHAPALNTPEQCRLVERFFRA